MKRRGIAQTRGPWRAILPHAISNGLAARALERISAPDFDAFSKTLSPRMLRSLSRRLGYLHDSEEAQATVRRWLGVDGPLGDLTALDSDWIAILRNLAPVAPQAVLTKISSATVGPNADTLIGVSARGRASLIGLVKALAFEPEMFDAAALTLVRFARAEPADNNNQPAGNSLKELFQLYLSGTQALIEQRIALARRLAISGQSEERWCGVLALEGLLKSDHFMSSHSFDFGARPRDHGWQPQSRKDIRNWYSKAIGFAVELKDLPEVNTSFARQIRSLWSCSGCHDDLDRAATAFSNGGVWINGWINFRAALSYDGKDMPDDIRRHLERIIDRLRPVDLLDRTRSLVLEWTNGGYDVVDVEHDGAEVADFHSAYHRASEAAVDVGKAVASSPSDLRTLLPEILSARQAPRAFEFGRGLAQASPDLRETWSALTAAYAGIAGDCRTPTMMGGFLAEAHKRDPYFTTLALDTAIDEPSLAACLPYLQARVAMDAAGITRLRTAIAKGALSSNEFLSIANGSIENISASDLKGLLVDVVGLPDGVGVAIRMLHMYLFCHQKAPGPAARELIDVGCSLLLRLNFDKSASRYDSDLRLVVRVCLTGFDAEDITSKICQNIKSNLVTWKVSIRDISNLMKGLFDAQPFTALNTFILGEDANSNLRSSLMQYGKYLPIERVASDVLTAWASRDPGIRYNLLGQIIGIFTKGHEEEQLQLSPLFLALLDRAPDKSAFLGDYYHRFRPNGWRGSLADVLVKRRKAVRQLGNHRDRSVQQWVTDMEEPVARWIEAEQLSDRRQEESFE